MTIRCRECQAESPGWAEFCLQCGRRFSDEERSKASEAVRLCESCGEEMSPGSSGCHNCGARPAGSMDRSAAQRISLIAKILALVPGIFNVFGLGHLFLGKYLKAFILFAISLALRYASEAWVSPGDMANADIAWLGVSLLVFIYQIWDVYRITGRELMGR